jgi:hypothetical protein
MDHLFNSTARVEEMRLTRVDGESSMSYVQATSDDEIENFMLQRLPCRIDMGFLRPGKDIAPAPEAGKAPDRIGVLFCAPYAPLKAGQRIVTIPNDNGNWPIKGTFEIRVVPDEAIGYANVHHIEVQIIETVQNLAGEWPNGNEMT